MIVFGMCRLFGFRSSVLSGVHQSLVAAENALAAQSAAHPDGWGVAYYNSRFPHIIRNDKQALADGLFKELSSVVATRTLVAHIRHATAGKVGILNCHPFQYGPWCFAHNGQVADFATNTDLQARLREAVDPRFRGHILGSTDSEVVFYIFMSRLARRVDDIFHSGIRDHLCLDAIAETLDTVLEVASHETEEAPNRLNFMVTNGSLLVGTCYRRTLFFSTYKRACPEAHSCSAYEAARCEQEVRDGIVKHLIVSSEVVAGSNVWVQLQDGDYVVVDNGMNFRRGRFETLSDTPAPKLPVVA